MGSKTDTCPRQQRLWPTRELPCARDERSEFGDTQASHDPSSEINMIFRSYQEDVATRIEWPCDGLIILRAWVCGGPISRIFRICVKIRAFRFKYVANICCSSNWFSQPLPFFPKSRLTMSVEATGILQTTALTPASLHPCSRSCHDYESSIDCETRRCRPSFASAGLKLFCWALAVVMSAGFANGAGHIPVILQVSPMDSVIHTKVGCGTNILFSAALQSTTGPFNETRLWAEFDSSYGFPPHTDVACNGQYLLKNGLRVCEGSYALNFMPTTQQADRTYTVCVKWQAGDAGPEGLVEASNTTCVSLTVVPPNPQFTTENVGRAASFTRTFNVGCEDEIRISAKDFAPETPPCSMYPVVVEALAQGSYPHYESGLPEGFMTSDGSGIVGKAELTMTGGPSENGIEYSFKWRPARGHESAVPYRICFQVRLHVACVVLCR